MDYYRSKFNDVESEVKKLRKKNQAMVNELNVLHAQVQVISSFIRQSFGTELFKVSSFVFNFIDNDKRSIIEEMALTIENPNSLTRRLDGRVEMPLQNPVVTDRSRSPRHHTPPRGSAAPTSSRNTDELIIRSTTAPSPQTVRVLITGSPPKVNQVETAVNDYGRPASKSLNKSAVTRTKSSTSQGLESVPTIPATITAVNVNSSSMLNDSGIVADEDPAERYYIIDLEPGPVTNTSSATDDARRPIALDLEAQDETVIGGQSSPPEKLRRLSATGTSSMKSKKAKLKNKENRKRSLVSCDLCGKSVKAEGLGDHMLLHSGKFFECKECGAKIVREYNYKLHMKRHQQQKRRFKCEQCDKSFLSRRELKIHSAYHQEGRPYKCDKCDATYPTRHRLRVHQVTHTGEQKYICPYCKKSFAYKSSLYLHEKLHQNRAQVRQRASKSPQPGSSREHIK